MTPTPLWCYDQMWRYLSLTHTHTPTHTLQQVCIPQRTRNKTYLKAQRSSCDLLFQSSSRHQDLKAMENKSDQTGRCLLLLRVVWGAFSMLDLPHSLSEQATGLGSSPTDALLHCVSSADASQPLLSLSEQMTLPIVTPPSHMPRAWWKKSKKILISKHCF